MAKQNGPGGHTSLNVWPLNWRWGRAGMRAQGSLKPLRNLNPQSREGACPSPVAG